MMSLAWQVTCCPHMAKTQVWMQTFEKVREGQGLEVNSGQSCYITTSWCLLWWPLHHAIHYEKCPSLWLVCDLTLTLLPLPATSCPWPTCNAKLFSSWIVKLTCAKPHNLISAFLASNAMKHNIDMFANRWCHTLNLHLSLFAFCRVAVFAGASWTECCFPIGSWFCLLAWHYYQTVSG